MSNGGPHLQLPGVPPGAQAVVKVNPCQVILRTPGNCRFCFDPSMIKAIEEVDGGGVNLHLEGLEHHIPVLCSYDKFLDRCGVTPQLINDEADDVAE